MAIPVQRRKQTEVTSECLGNGIDENGLASPLILSNGPGLQAPESHQEKTDRKWFLYWLEVLVLTELLHLERNG